MKIIIALIFVLLASNQAFSQETKLTNFHRLLVMNENNELLMVKVKGNGLWMTPGVYQTGDLIISKGLENVAADYGLKIDRPALRGMFVLRTDFDNSTNVRNFFVANSSNDITKMPVYVSESRWMKPAEAYKVMGIPHISEMIKQVLANPTKVSGGTLRQFKKGNKHHVEQVEDFYLFAN